MSGSAQMYMDYLADEGYRPSIDEDGDVVFKSEGLTYFVGIEEDDEAYFRIVLPNFWSIDSEDELVKAVMAAGHATAMTKVAKIFVRPDGKDTIASIELFLEDPRQFEGIFQRSMSALMAALNHFREKMEED